MESAFARPVATVLASFGVDEHDGLTSKHVEQLRHKYGRNGASRTLSSFFVCGARPHGPGVGQPLACEK